MTLRMRRFLLWTSAHALLTMCAIVYASAASSANFDNPELPRSATGRASAIAANTLMLPGSLVWTAWASRNLPNALEWLLFLANSSVCGLAVVGVSAMVPRRSLPMRHTDS